MGFLEKLFLRQFQADGADYVIVRRGQEARFSATEVMHFIEEWRLLWLAKWLWGGWLLIGVMVPLWLTWRGYGAGAFALAFVAGAFMVAVLTPVWRKPVDAAELRLPPEPEDGRKYGEAPALWKVIFFGGIFLVSSVAVWNTGVSDPSSWRLLFIWAAAFAINAWQWWRYRQGKLVAGSRDPVLGALLIAMCLGVVSMTALDSDRSMFDIVVAGIAVVMSLSVAWGMIWRKIRPERFA